MRFPTSGTSTPRTSSPGVSCFSPDPHVDHKDTAPSAQQHRLCKGILHTRGSPPARDVCGRLLFGNCVVGAVAFRSTRLRECPRHWPCSRNGRQNARRMTNRRKGVSQAGYIT
eukprot:UN4099